MMFFMHSILIIDDEADNLKALERTLTTVAQVHSAASGKEGLEILKKETYRAKDPRLRVRP